MKPLATSTMTNDENNKYSSNEIDQFAFFSIVEESSKKKYSFKVLFFSLPIRLTYLTISKQYIFLSFCFRRATNNEYD